MERHIMERWQNKTKSRCRGIIGKGLLHSTALRESGNHLHSDPAGVLNMPPPLPGLSGLPVAFQPTPVPILFGKPCCSLLNIPLRRWDSPEQLQCHILPHPTCWQCELHPSLAPALWGGTEHPPHLHCFPTSAWKIHPRTTSPKQHQSSGEQKKVKGKLFIAKPSSFVVKYCLILSLRHLLSHSPYYFSSYYRLIFPIQKARTDTSQFPSWHNCLGETRSCFTGVLKN